MSILSSTDMKCIYEVSFTVLDSASYSSIQSVEYIYTESDSVENAIEKSKSIFDSYELAGQFYYWKKDTKNKDEQKIIKLIDDIYVDYNENYSLDEWGGHHQMSKVEKSFFLEHKNWKQIHNYVFSLLKGKKLKLDSVKCRRSGHSE